MDVLFFLSAVRPGARKLVDEGRQTPAALEGHSALHFVLIKAPQPCLPVSRPVGILPTSGVLWQLFSKVQQLQALATCAKKSDLPLQPYILFFEYISRGAQISYFSKTARRQE